MTSLRDRADARPADAYVSAWVRRAASGTLPATDRTGAVFAPISPRRLAKIERMRTQRIPSATRHIYAPSGRPDLASPGVWKTLALYNLASSQEDDK